ncbi:YtpR family tRNA-binding protein [Sporolactobacillus spathodeae]|uniref:tRNA-binding protein n=1 Tax=Sporolactobacillus spathodeae TaxID=1465502 RepID=A0ABS2QD70_9BACL|nr:DUF4479 family protein [Sporolactobacillus spathodeae]MBM7658887.1 tRNA-binding protein [Sporolactobacillus spathodeae]
MIFYYNKSGIGDTLIVYKNDATKTEFERKEDVARIVDLETKRTTGYNFFNISQVCPLEDGQVPADAALLSLLNDKLKRAGFDEQLTVDEEPAIVTGFVQEMKKHPDSDHMHVCKVDIGTRTLQIVCGAPNIDQGQHVVVARIGALMPDGMIIRPTVLRGIPSDGMICSARELALPNAPQRRGILVLDRESVPGRDFFADFKQHA